MAGKEVKVTVVAETKKFRAAFRRLANDPNIRGLKRAFADAAKGVAVAGGAIGAAAIGVGAKLASMGADLEQSIGAIDDVFKGAADQMHAFANTAATSVGLSTNAYNELATVIGSQLKNAGTPMDQLAGKTNDLITTGADLAAMFGGSTQDAVNALSSALKGERDPIERYGVSLKQAAIDAKAAELGFTKVGGSFDQEAQTAATLALIMEQTADAHGKFAREGDTLAHQTQVMQASLQSFGEKVGAAVVPVITELASKVNDWLGPRLDSLASWVTTTGVPAIQAFATTVKDEWIPRLQEVAQWVGDNLMPIASNFATFLTGTLVPAVMDVGQWLKDNAANIAPVAAAIGVLVGAWKAWTFALQAWRTIQLLATAAQAAFNLVAAMNPIGLIVIAIAAVVAGIATFLATHEGARQKLAEIWESIKTFFSGALDGIKAGLAWFESIPSKFSEWFEGAKAAASEKLSALVDFVTGIPGRIISAIGALGGLLAAAAVQHFTHLVNGAKNTVGNLLSFVRSIPSRILSALGNLGSLLLNVGRQVIDGFIQGIKNSFNAVKNTLGDLTSKLTSWKGPADRDATLLTGAGQLVIEGFIRGLESRYAHVRASLQGLTSMVADTSMPDIGVPGGVAYRGANGAHITINLQTLTPTIEAGKNIADALDAYLTINGRRTGMGAFA